MQSRIFTSMKTIFRIFLLAALTFPGTLSAQRLDGFTLLENGQSGRALASFPADFESSRRGPAAFWGAALACADLQRADSAYQFVLQAHEAYRAAGTGKKKAFVRFGLDPQEMNRLKRSLEERALGVALEDGSLQAIDHFLDTYIGAPRRLRQEVLAKRNALALNLALTAATYDDCAALLDGSGREAARQYPEIYELAMDRLFDLFVLENGWRMLDVLGERFPELGLLRDPWLDEFLEIRESGDASLFEEFSRQYPESRLAQMATDSAAAGVFRSLAGDGSLEDYCAFIVRWPGSSYVGQLDPWLAEAFSNSPFLHILEPALRGVDPAQLPLTMEALYRRYHSTGRLSDLLNFETRYPGFPQGSGRLSRDQELARRFGAITAMLSSGEATHSAVSEELDDLIRKWAPDYPAILALQVLIEPDLISGALSDALVVAKSYRPKFAGAPDQLNALLNLLTDSPSGVIRSRLDSTVNTSFAEYSPVISADGKHLYFCRDEGMLLNSDENILISELTSDGFWGSAVSLPPFDGREHESPLAISSDGSTLLLFREGRIMTSRRTASGWSTPQPAGAAINESRWQGGASLSADGKALIFAAIRPECLGPGSRDVDLFVAVRKSDDTWGTPINLGPAINTTLEDRSPFLHPDQKTLYFSSRGHGGLGKLDVFKAVRTGHSWTDWSTPVNLGREINTPGDDWGYKVSTDGQRAYYAGGGGPSLSDILTVTLPESLRPDPVSTIAGLVLDDSSGSPLEATILIEDLTTGREVATLTSSPATGAFFITLPQGGLYSYTITRQGYLDAANHLDLTGVSTPVNRIERTVRLRTLTTAAADGASLVLNNLFFDTDSATLRPESFPQLRRLAALLNRAQLPIEIAGHTDNEGSATYNQTLSEARAQSVKSWLIDNGVDSSLLKSAGYGESRPIAPNTTPESRARNRRVEITFR